MFRLRFVWWLLFCGLPTLQAGTYTVTNDIEYTRPDGVSVKLDAHVPSGNGPFPTVILVHGGGWTAGDKAGKIVQPLFQPLTDSGFTWFSINYRLAPDYPYPAAADDVEAAVRFVKAHAREYKVDASRIALMGESAGGHLVNLVGARNRVGVAAVVCFYGPIDMVQWAKRFDDKPMPPSAKAFFGIDGLDAAGLAKIRETSPAIYLNSKTPPFLVIHGTKDEAVDYSQALLTVELFKKLGVPCKLITVEDGVHGVVNWEKEARFQGYKPEMVKWLHQTLQRTR
ncbi:MAG: alpha/beta hydrolase [Acidobacteriota bacterium]|nr:alpha/beta hydrolase [Acidobacteriota bacterium]